ncbi:hypothetical protein J3D48_004269 [Pseudomonas fluorescens]|uniref:AbiTii domain-containing protein n=1 Tax=Pseudomonas fluorescens TaxID=294 RepID=UPI00209DE043|nr:hypothetical protein [Pseudomonas fluorescens]MCP1487956.1 hypothetical protein [Pseudomonas fluorescens]
MKLIDEAIDLLGDGNESLSKAFFKAQIIAHKLQDKEFAAWVLNEIQGYGDKAALPDYRKVSITPYGNVGNFSERYSNLQLPITDMPVELREKFLVSHFYQSIAVIEEFSKNDDGLRVNLDRRLYAYLRAGFDKSAVISSAWGLPPAGCFTQMLNEARSRLLDLLLKLSDLVPATTQEGEHPSMPKIQGLNELFKGAVFGHGANISLAIGEGNQASYNSNSVVVNDLDSLVRLLSESNVSSEDIADLKTAIEADANVSGSAPKSFGEKVSGWLAIMIRKAGTSAWEIPVQVGAGLLTNALTKYYGF